MSLWIDIEAEGGGTGDWGRSVFRYAL